MPKPTDVVDSLETKYGEWDLTADGGIITKSGHFHGSYPGLPSGFRQGVRYFVKIRARRDGAPGYVLMANDGARYAFPLGG
jgi:hypothetical protein